jgi:hypothetical protein
VRNALPRLQSSGEIETVEGRHAIVDPLFADWITALNRVPPELI